MLWLLLTSPFLSALSPPWLLLSSSGWIHIYRRVIHKNESAVVWLSFATKAVQSLLLSTSQDLGVKLLKKKKKKKKKCPQSICSTCTTKKKKRWYLLHKHSYQKLKWNGIKSRSKSLFSRTNLPLAELPSNPPLLWGRPEVLWPSLYSSPHLLPLFQSSQQSRNLRCPPSAPLFSLYLFHRLKPDPRSLCLGFVRLNSSSPPSS